MSIGKCSNSIGNTVVVDLHLGIRPPFTGTWAFFSRNWRAWLPGIVAQCVVKVDVLEQRMIDRMIDRCQLGR
jgi:hypothetical protein